MCTIRHNPYSPQARAIADIPKDVVFEPFEPPMPRCLPRFQQLFEELTFGRPRAGSRIIVCWILVRTLFVELRKGLRRCLQCIHLRCFLISAWIKWCGTRVIFSGICMSCMSLTLWLMWAPSWRSGGLYCLAFLLFCLRGLAFPHWMVLRWSSPMPLLGSSQLPGAQLQMITLRWEGQRSICCKALRNHFQRWSMRICMTDFWS